MTDQKFSSLFVHQPKWIRSKNQKIITTGDPTDRLFWIEQGKVRRTRDGRIFKRNSFLEVLSFFGSDLYSADAVSLSQTELRVISRSDGKPLSGFGPLALVIFRSTQRWTHYALLRVGAFGGNFFHPHGQSARR